MSSPKYSGFSDEQSRALAAELAKLRAELEALRTPDRVLDRRGQPAAIRPRPGDIVRAQAGDVVVLPHPRSAKGRAPVVVLVEGQPVDVLAESGTVNDEARVTVEALGAMTWWSTGDEWWGSAVGGTDGSGAPTGGPLGDQPGLSVIGRAPNTTGPVAAITSTAEHQVLRNNGTELEWDFPIQVGAAAASWLFDGVNDSITHGDVLDKERTDAFSLTGWFQTSTSNGFIQGKFETAPTTRGYATQLASGRVRFVLSSTNTVSVLAVETNSTFNNNVLHHFRITYAGTSLASGVVIAIDDVVQATTTVFNNLTTTTLNSAEFTIGILGGLAGLIQHFAIWNRVLTTGEGTEVYGAGVPPDLSGVSAASALQGWWRIDGTDTTAADGVIDYGSDNNDGTAQGGLGAGSSVQRVHSLTAGDGIDISAAAGVANFAVDVTDIVDAVSITEVSPNNIQRAALTGDVTASAGSNTTAIAAGVIVDADVNVSAAIDQTKLGATTGFSVKASGSAATTSAEPIVTYSASANMSAERVTTSSTSVTVSTSVANQIEFQRAALTGDVTASANSNTTAIAAGVIVDADVNAAANIAPTKLDLAALVAAIDSTSIASTGTTLVREALTGEVTAATNSNATTITRSTAFTWTGSHDFAGTGTAFNVNVDNASSIDTASTFALASSGSTTMNFGNNSSVSVTGSLDVLATTDITLDADDRVFVTGAGILQVGDGVIEGYLVMQASTTSAPNVASSEGMFWVEDPGSEITRPKYTDDADVDHTLVMTDTQTITGATGNLGTIDITGLACGGTVNIGSSASGAHQIEGFTSTFAYDGFFFHVTSNTSQTTQYLNQDATATAADRIQLAGNVDSAALSFHHATFTYFTNRWRGIVAATGA